MQNTSRRRFAALSDAQLLRSSYLAMLLACLLPPFVGGTLMGFMGFYPLPEFYLIFGNYRILIYVGVVLASGLALVPGAVRTIAAMTQMKGDVAQVRARRIFARLPWLMLAAVTLYCIGGALIADYTLAAMGVRSYTLREHLYNQIGLLPVVLVTAYPIFFFYVGQLGRYLAPRGINAIVIPLWVKLLMMGIVTPMLIESFMIGYYLNHTGHFEWTTLALWMLLGTFALAGTGLAWLSLRQSLLPLEEFISARSGSVFNHPQGKMVPLSLDELGALTARYAELISELQQLSNNLRASESHMEEAQRLAHVGSWELNLPTGELVWSDEIFRIFEIDKNKFGATYAAFLNAIHPDDRDAVNQAYTNSLITRSPYEITHRLRMNDGRIKWVREQCQSDFDVAGKPLRSVGTVQDISERKQAELAQAQSESLFRTLAQVAPVGIFHCDASGACTYVNDQYCAIAGIKPDKAAGDGWLTNVYPEDRSKVLGMWEQTVKNNIAFYLEYRFRRPTGHTTWVVGRAQAELGEGGEVLGYVGTITDINERKLQESSLQRFNEELEHRVKQRTEQLLAAKDEAEAASRSKSLFLTSMSHELRTPLNAILGYSQLMQLDSNLPPQVAENAREIRRAGDYLLALINDVLDLARIESGRVEMQTRSFELAEILNQCRTQNKQAAASRNITLHCDDSCQQVQIEADSRRLLQVLNNLVSNAIKYNRENGKVTLSCSATANNRVRISVSDNGNGIAPDKLEQLFQPFNRLGAEMSKIEGTGIGLVISKRLIEGMAGSMGVESVPGTGSTFWVELPGTQGAAPHEQTQTQTQTTRWVNRVPRVLVAEDYAPNRNILRMQLQSLGCAIEMASDGSEALKIHRATACDLVLTDLNMPVMDGISLAKAIRQDEAAGGGHVPIIAITAAAESSELKRCRDAGMDDTLTKPLALEKLRAIFTRYLGFTAVKAVPQQPEIARQTEDAILDVNHLYRTLGRIDLEQAQSLIATFVVAARDGLLQLSGQVDDRSAVAREMHKQKSSALTVGAIRYANLALSLEQQARSGDVVTMETDIDSLRLMLDEIKQSALGLQVPARTDAIPGIETTTTNFHSVLIVDDDPVLLQQMTSILSMLGVAEIATAKNGREAIAALAASEGKVEVLLCDLNMPEMDGVELIREFGKTGFSGSLILMSGADDKVLSTVTKLAGMQNLRVLGQLRKPVLPAHIAPLLAQAAQPSETKKRAAFVAPQVTVDALCDGIAGGEFSIWFQPKVDSITLSPVGVEALARWKRPDGRYIPPDIFITVAEQSGLIGDLSRILLTTALLEGEKLFTAGFPLKIAVNLSGRWLNDLDLPEFVLAKTHAAKLEASDVVLEVTETGVMDDPTTALDVLTRLRLKGFGLSIDDFGIGYSSFEQLGRIPFTEMKLDRSFVNRGGQEVAARAILESSMDMARKLGLSTVAEGVETEAELGMIRSLGCDKVQGYYVAKPMPLDDLLVWLRSR